MKKMIEHHSGTEIRTLYKMKDRTYKVRIETFDHEKNQYNPSYDINYGLFSEALACVNYERKRQ